VAELEDELEAAQAELEAAAPPARGPAPPSALAPRASPPSGVGLLEPAPARDGVVSQRPAGRELREAKPDEARAKMEADAEEATDGQGRRGRRRPLLDCQFSDLSVPETLLWLALTDYFDYYRTSRLPAFYASRLSLLGWCLS